MTVLPVLSIALIAACALIAGCTSVAAVRRRYIVVTVRGSSMCPTYDDADRVLVRRTRSVPMCGPLRGEVIVLRAPVRALAEISPLLVKRVAAVPGDEIPPDFRQAAPLPLVPPGQLLVRGDNDRSADSRSFGLIDFGLIVGTVVRGKQLNHSGRRLPLRLLSPAANRLSGSVARAARNLDLIHGIGTNLLNHQ